MRKYIYYLVFGLALVSCSGIPETDVSYLHFLVKCDNGNTKAALINDEASMIEESSSFDIMIFDDIKNEKDIVTYNSGKWMSSKKHSFFSDSSVDMFAVAPSGYCTVYEIVCNYNSHSVSFPYNYTDASFNDKDLLCGYFSGIVSRGIVPITFYHPLSSLIFKMGNDDSGYTVKEVSISEVATSGTCSIQFANQDSSSPVISWNELNIGEDIKVSSKKPSPSKDDYFTEPLMVIPQTIGASSEAELGVTISVAGVDRKLSCKLAGTVWKPGEYYTYKVIISKDKLSLESSISAWGVETENWPVYINNL